MKLDITTSIDVDPDDMRRYTGDAMTDVEVIEHATEIARAAFQRAIYDSELGYFAWPVH